MSSHHPAATGAPDDHPSPAGPGAPPRNPPVVGGSAPTRPTDPGLLRELIIDAGLELLTRDGLHLAARTLSYGSVLAHLQESHGVRVGRASVHERIWASNAEFRRDVIAAALGHLPADFLGSQGPAVRDTVVDVNRRDLDVADRMAEFGRRMAPVVFSAAADLPGFRNTQLAKALASSINDPDTATALGQAVRERGDAVVDALSGRFAILTSRLRFRPRADLGLDDDQVHRLIATISLGFIIGGCLDQAVGNDMITEPFTLGGLPADAPSPWTSVGVGLWAYYRCLYEDAGTPSDDTIQPLPPPGPMTTPTIDTTNHRRQRQELRELVLAAGVELLLGQRFDLRPGTLAYTTVFDHIERRHGFRLYRSTVHNSLWSSHLEYWLEVLARAADSDLDLCPAAERILAADAAGERPLPARDLIRAVISAEADATTVSPAFVRRQMIKASLLSEPPSPPIEALRAQMRERDRERIDGLAAALGRPLVDSGRYQVRPGLGIAPSEALTIVARVALTVTNGNLFDQAAGVTAASETITLRGPDGSDAEWTIPAVATWACFDALFAPTPLQGEDGASAPISSTLPSA